MRQACVREAWEELIVRRSQYRYQVHQSIANAVVRQFDFLGRGRRLTPAIIAGGQIWLP
jgi:hypothetical protein